MSFSDEDLSHVASSHEDALVITEEVNAYDVKRIHIDLGSSTDVLFLEAYMGMEKSMTNLKKIGFPLIGIAGRTTYHLGAIRLSVVVGDGWKAQRMKNTFIVVDASNSYNAILGHTT